MMLIIYRPAVTFLRRLHRHHGVPVYSPASHKGIEVKVWHPSQAVMHIDDFPNHPEEHVMDFLSWLDITT
jgi:hypothetical protein